MIPVLKSIFRDRFIYGEERLEICRKCEFFEQRWKRCQKCGCFMDAKVLFHDSECPIGKWGKRPVDIPDQVL